MDREPQGLLVVWVLAALPAVVTSAMTGAPTAAMLGRIACPPRRLDAKADGCRHDNAAESRDG
jgi:hypothetical protein